MTDNSSTITIGEHLREARTAAGLSRNRAARRLEIDYGLVISEETLRRYEAGLVQLENLDITLMIALANLYGVRLAGLSADVNQRVNRLRDLLDRTPVCVTAVDPAA